MKNQDLIRGYHFTCLKKALSSTKQLVPISREVKENYSIAILDVAGSTKVTERLGTSIYSHLPMVVLAGIKHFANKILGDDVLPMGFTGDGAFAVIPNQLIKEVQSVLDYANFLANKKEIRGYISGIRAAIIPLTEIKSPLSIFSYGKIGSPQYGYLGGAIEEAETKLKCELSGDKLGRQEYDPTGGELEDIFVEHHQPFFSNITETITIIVKPKSTDIDLIQSIYREITANLIDIQTHICASTKTCLDSMKIYDSLYAVIPSIDRLNKKIMNLLVDLENRGHIVFGVARTDRVIKVCSINRGADNREIFIDSHFTGTGKYWGGGYTAASKILKAKLQRKHLLKDLLKYLKEIIPSYEFRLGS